MKKETALIGAHMSIEGGFHMAIERSEEIGATAVQIFTKSNRQWRARSIHEDEIFMFKEAWKRSSISSVSAHASYLLNLASVDEELQKKSTIALVEEINRCHALGISNIVLHPGSSTKSHPEAALRTVIKNLNTALGETPGNVIVSLELMAGQGSVLCSTIEELAIIIDGIQDQERVGVCIDTCHAFAAGYLLDTHAHYESFWNAFKALINKKRVTIIHTNDSKAEFNKHVDRHEQIGKGKMGLKPFALIMGDHELAHVPKILEIPKATVQDYRDNIEILRSFVK